MSHTRSHSVRHNVTDGGQDAGRTQGVTLLQTRPDQSLFVTQVCGVSGYSFHPSHGDLPRMDGRFAAEIGGGR